MGDAQEAGEELEFTAIMPQDIGLQCEYINEKRAKEN